MSAAPSRNAKIVAAAAFLALAVLALAPGGWSGALAQTAPTATPTPTATTTTVGPNESQVVKAGSLALVIDGGDIADEPVIVTVQVTQATATVDFIDSAVGGGLFCYFDPIFDHDVCAPVPADLETVAVITLRTFSIDATGANSGNTIENLDGEVFITIELTADDLAVIDSTPGDRQVYSIASDKGDSFDCTIAGTVATCGPVDHFSEWVFFALALQDAQATPTNTPGPADTGAGVFDNEDGANTLALALAALAVIAVAGAGARTVTRRS